MMQRTITLPELALIAGTRVAFGIGLGLLVSERLNNDTRHGAGWALVAVGVLSTIPLVVGVLGEEPEIRRSGRRMTRLTRGFSAHTASRR
jgi:hypothetical protein